MWVAKVVFPTVEFLTVPTRFKTMLSETALNLPQMEPLPGRTLAVSFVFLGDDAFPLSPKLLKP